MSAFFSISPRSKKELAKRAVSSSFGHMVLATVVYFFTDLERDFPLVAHSFIALIVIVNVTRLLRFGIFKSRIFFIQLALIAFGWGGFCSFAIHQYGIQHSSTLVLLLVTCGVAAAALTALVPSFVGAVLFLTFLLLPPFFLSATHSAGEPLALMLITYYLFLILQIRTQAREYLEREQIEDTLKEKNLQLDRAANVKSQFIANVSHEIRTPINGILGMANLLRKENLSDDGKNYLNIMTTCGDTLLTLINDILDFSKMEAGKLILEDVNFNVNMLLRDVIILFNSRAKDKGIGLSLKSSIPDDFWVLTDSTRLRQVLNNLVGNAIKFTPKGEVCIITSIKEVSDDKIEINVSIKDSGIGIPDDVKDKLFQSFTQVDASTTRKYGGTGLGLVICKGICESMGGSIGFESQLGVGTTFSFKVSARKGNRKNAGEVDGFEFDRDLARKKPYSILVADDNSTNQLLAKQYLEMLGYRVDAVGNGLEVLDAIDTKFYDVIFMDGQMPEMDGYITTKTLRRRLAVERQPWIIALTASATMKDQKYCRDAGMDDFVPKPFTVISLAEAILRVRSNTTMANEEAKTNKVQTQKTVHLNKDLLLQHFAGDEEILIKFINGYLKTVPNLLGNLQTAVTKKDAKLLRISAHTLRGTIANFFANDICKKLDVIEHAENLSWENIGELVNTAEGDINELGVQLSSFLNSRNAA
ncbi:MAG: hypothetical protein A4S09_04595 [Proteobacteria bacterium SG_bin7]|nr:MAG: hypothetical protein A4S09_04595 [Proteobacteria bacterium SG_bin7]